MSLTWTREAVEALGPTTDVPTTASVLSISDWTVYELIRRGEWTATRVLRLGRKIRIPTHDLVVLLYGTPETCDTGPAQDRPATYATPPTEGRDEPIVRAALDSPRNVRAVR